MRGARLLAVLGVALFAAFWLQRARSPFLRIEAERGLAQRVAEDAGLTAVDVMALRELLGAGLDEADLRSAALDFAAARATLGNEDLAILVVTGERPLAERLLREASGDAGAAAVLLRPLPEAFSAVRFRATRERFADRLPD